MTEKNTKYMQMAIDASRENVKNCGGPFGAVIVNDKDEVLSVGVNRVTANNDPTAHAEVSAIRAACQKKGDFSLKDCVIYSSCEPCPMCLSAIYWSGIRKIYYGNTARDAERIGFSDRFIYKEISKPRSERAVPCECMMRDEAQSAFNDWENKTDKTPY